MELQFRIVVTLRAIIARFGFFSKKKEESLGFLPIKNNI